MKDMTMGEVWTIIVAGISAFLLLAQAAEKIAAAIKAAKAPNEEQSRDIAELKEWRKEVDRKLSNDQKTLEDIKKGNQAMYTALLALLDHGIDGNNIKQMQDAKSELYSHLTDK